MSDMHIVIPIFPGVQPLDVVGPMEVFAAAAEILEHTRAAGARPLVSVVGTQPAVRAPSGLMIACLPIESIDPQTIDTLLLPGGDGMRDGTALASLRPWLMRVIPGVRRVASVCTGAFALADLGLLDGKRAATHWAYARQLARRYPSVSVDDDAIYVRSGDVWTSAGVTAGIDLALALVEEDFGGEVAQHVARWLVVPHRRSGGQSQHAVELWAKPVGDGPVRLAQEHVRKHLGSDLRIEALARTVGMSPRNFQRVFRDTVGIPPKHFITRCRIEEAKRLLEVSELSLPDVASRTGFGTDESLRRAFIRAFGMPPATWRARNRSPKEIT